MPTRILVQKDTGTEVTAVFFWRDGDTVIRRRYTIPYQSAQEARQKLEDYWTAQQNRVIAESQQEQTSFAGWKWDGESWSR